VGNQTITVRLGHWLMIAALLLAFVVALVPGVALAQDPAPARQGTTPEETDVLAAAATPAQAAAALDLASGVLNSLSFGASDPQGYQVLATAPAVFLAQGGTVLALSSGCTNLALTPNSAPDTSCQLGGLNNSQGQDLVQMTLVLNVPPSAQSWYVNWKFLSEEFPEWVNTDFNDVFLIERGSSTFIISGNTVTAPNNVAFDQNNNLITINTTGALGMLAANATGTTYDGATVTLSTAANIPPATTSLTLIFSVMDLGDSVYDTTVFLDNFRFSGNPVGGPVTEPAEVCGNGIDDNLNGQVDEGCNQPPVADAGGPYAGVEGSPVAFDGGASSDPDNDPLTYAWDFGDGGTGTGATPSHTYAENGNYNVCLTVTDDDQASNQVCTTATIANAAPAIPSMTVSPATIDEDGTVTVSGSFTDAGVLDTHTVNILWGDGSSSAATVTQGAGGGTFTASHQYLDDDPTATTSDIKQITATVTDDDGDSGTYTANVTVNNVAPVISGITVPVDPQAMGTSVSISASFSDVGTLDTHTCTIDWDNGAGPVAGTVSAGACTGANTYAAAGVYAVTVTVTDDDTGQDAMTATDLIVIYDPSAGFVTGGGWYNSGAGADQLYPDATGKANFGFVAKYKKGANVPDGQTEFQFKAGDLNFHSSAYEWLVVTGGCMAQYKGTGTVNGEAGYRFLITLRDGNLCSSPTTDGFRIKITGPGDVLRYDNRLGDADTIGNETGNVQSIDGGSIVIHRK